MDVISAANGFLVVAPHYYLVLYLTTHALIGAYFFRNALVPNLIERAFLGDEDCAFVLRLLTRRKRVAFLLVLLFLVVWPIVMTHAAISAMRG